MARPKTKSKLVEGMMELVNSLRNIESQLSLLSKSQKRQSTGRRGRPPGSGAKGKRGRPAGSGKGPGRPPGKKTGKRGRPPGAKNRKPGRPAKSAGRGRPSGKRRGRPPGSKNK